MSEAYFPTEIRVGGESQLPSGDEYAFGAQITAMPGGNFLATWLDESSAHLWAQIVHANGHTLGSPAQIQPKNGRLITDWYDVAILEDGEIWVVATQVVGESDFQVSVTSLQGEELLSGPAPQITPSWYLVDGNPDGAQITPSITIMNNGSAAITWMDALQNGSGPFGFGAGSVNLNIMPSPSMTSTGAITVNNLNLSSGQFQTSVSTLQNGNFVVVWDGVEIGGPGQTIQFQILNENGIKVGLPKTVPAGNDVGPFGGQVAALSDGGFVVVWQSATSIDGLSDVAYRVYSDAGNLVSSGIAHENIVGLQMDPTVIATGTGGFIVGWTDASGVQDDPGTGSFARVFNAVGSALTDAFLLNEATIGEQTAPQLAVSEDRLAAVWQSYSDSTAVPIDTTLFQVFDMGPEKVTPSPQDVLAVGHDTDGDLLITQRGSNGPNSFVISELVKGDARIPIVNQSEIEFTSDDPDLVPVVFRDDSGRLGVWANGEVGSNAAIITDADTLFELDGDVFDRSTFDLDYSALPPNPDRTASAYDLPNGMQLRFEFKTEFGGRSIFTELQVLDEQGAIIYAEPIIYPHLLPTDVAFGADTVYILHDYPNSYGFIATIPLLDLESVFYKSLERTVFGKTPQSENWEEIVFHDDRLFVFVDSVDLEGRSGLVQLIQELDLNGNPVGRPFILVFPA